MQCPKCKHELSGTGRFCENCGCPVENVSYAYPVQAMPKKIPNIVIIIATALIIALFCLAGAIVFSSGKEKPQESASKANDIQASVNTKPAAQPDGPSPDTSAVQNSPSGAFPPMPEEAPEAPEETDTLGTLTIEIAGRTKEYTPVTELTYDGRAWSVKFAIDGDTQKDYFYLVLPGNVKAGSKYSFSDGPKSQDDRFYDLMDKLNRIELLGYKNEGGAMYYFGNTIGTGNPSTGSSHYSSSATVTIDGWDGAGGEATGTITGEIKPSPNDSVLFKNGKFKIKIKSNGF